MENSLEPISNLNFFQRIRKKLYLRSMNPDKAIKYLNLPDYLRNDLEIIKTVCELENSLINSIPSEKVEVILNDNPQLINSVYGTDKISAIVKQNPEIVQHIADKNIIYYLIFNTNMAKSKEFFSLCPKDIQSNLLTTNSIEYTCFGRNYRSILSKDNIPIEYLDFDIVLKKAIAEHSNIMEKFKKTNNKSDYIPMLSKFDLSKLPLEQQLKLMLVSVQYSPFVSDEAIEKYVDKNPLILEMLPQSVQHKFIKLNPEILKKMSKKIQKEYVDRNRYTNDIPELSGFNIKKYFTPEQVKRSLIEKDNGVNIKEYGVLKQITELKNDEYIWELGKFQPKILRMSDTVGNDYSNLMRNMHLMRNIYKHVFQSYPNGELSQYIDTFIRYDDRNNVVGRKPLSSKDIDEINMLTKFLTNDDIMQKVPQNILLNYVQNPEHDKLIKIVQTTYGNEAARVLEDRPQLTLNEISNFYMFSPDIINEFGIGAVHAALSVDTAIIPAMFSELARNPDKMKEFKEFADITEGMFEDSVIGLERKLRAFEISQDLLKQIHSIDLSDVQKENLMVAFEDILAYHEQSIMDFPSNLEELEGYIKTRNKMYDNAIARSIDGVEIKQLMSKRYFGLDFLPIKDKMILREPSVLEMVRAYNLDYFTNHDKTLESGEYSQDDLDALELLSIFSSIQDVNVLKELTEVLSKNPNIINPVNYNKLRSRVPLTYTKDFVESLITPDKAMQMIAEGREGIRVREKDGIKIITLEGIDFTAFVTNPFMTNSGLSIRVDALNLADIWRNFENGITTFSGCPIDQDESKSTISSGGIGLGFGTIDPRQIVGMGITDIMTSHTKRETQPSLMFGFGRVGYKYSEDFMTDFLERLEVNDTFQDHNHRYGEVAANRRNVELSEIESGTNGGRVMPDYIYVKGNGESAIELAKAFDLKYIFEHDEEKYIGRNTYARIQKRNEKDENKRKRTRFMEQVEGVTRGDIGDDGR